MKVNGTYQTSASHILDRYGPYTKYTATCPLCKKHFPFHARPKLLPFEAECPECGEDIQVDKQDMLEEFLKHCEEKL